MTRASPWSRSWPRPGRRRGPGLRRCPARGRSSPLVRATPPLAGWPARPEDRSRSCAPRPAARPQSRPPPGPPPLPRPCERAPPRPLRPARRASGTPCPRRILPSSASACLPSARPTFRPSVLPPSEPYGAITSRVSRSAVWEPRSGPGGYASRALERRSYVSHARSTGLPRNSTPAARLKGRAPMVKRRCCGPHLSARSARNWLRKR